ncbi:unnamed protein product [Symbiodinium sp. CCMP2456]|nr:unnamed protein product [Symbiodinium sp. CCMP2456]
MTIWTEGLYDLGEEYDWLEFFAGHANGTGAVRLRGFRGAKFDIQYFADYRDSADLGTTNFMDITTPAGFCLGIIFLLKCRSYKFVAWFGLTCSSFSSMNASTSGRSPSSSTGHDFRPTVQEGNLMVERVCLLCALTVALGGTFIVEQPGGSSVEYYPTFRGLCTSLMRNDGVAAVSRVGWYMGYYFGTSLKRQYAYSNSPAVRKLQRDKVQATQRLCNLGKIKTVTRVKHPSGKERFSGTSQLKGTERLRQDLSMCCSVTI